MSAVPFNRHMTESSVSCQLGYVALCLHDFQIFFFAITGKATSKRVNYFCDLKLNRPQHSWLKTNQTNKNLIYKSPSTFPIHRVVVCGGVWGWGMGVMCTIKLRDVSLVGKMTFTEDQRTVMNSWVPHYAFMKLM